MKETVLGVSEDSYRRKTKEKLWLCIAVGLAVTVLNVLLAVFRRESNHSTHLLLNIVTDIAAGWFLLGYSRMVLTPRYRLYRLATSNPSGTYTGTVISVSDQQEYHEGLFCHRVQIGERMLFLPCDGAICLTAGEEVTLLTVGHLITEATR